MATTQKIGFANKFFTLWNVSENLHYDSYGRSYKRIDFGFIKNISMDLDKVRELYPELEYDEELRGRKKFSKRIYLQMPDDTFNFGKYTGCKFSEVDDTDYMTWYFNVESSEQRKEVLAIVLESRGYVLHNGRYISKAEYDKEMESIEFANKHFEEIINGNVDNTIYPERNLAYDGSIIIDDITYVFPEVKESFYNGYEFYLPLLKGKAKRIKNKTIRIKKFEVIDNDERIIKIIDFEVVK